MRKQLNRKAALMAAVVLGSGGSFFASHAFGATTYTWNKNTSGSPADGSGNWNATGTDWYTGSADVVWPNTTSYIATFGVGGAGGTVTLSGTETAGGLTFNSDTAAYTLTGGSITFGAANGAIVVGSGANNPQINSLLAGTGGITVSGGGTVTFGDSANTFTGGLTITGSGTTVDFNSATFANFGGTSSGITLSSGGTLNLTGATNPVDTTHIITVGTGGGTIDVSGGSGASSKFEINATNYFTGSGALTKSGAGDLLIYSGQNYSGTVTITAGTVEDGSTTGLGTGSVVLQGGELSLNIGSNTITNAVTVNSSQTGVFGEDSSPVSVYGGTLTDNGALTMALGYFYSTGNESMTLSSASVVTGSGTIGLQGGGIAGAANYAAPSGQVLTLGGNNSTFTGTLDIVDTPVGAGSATYNATATSGYQLVMGNSSAALGALNSSGKIIAASTPDFVQEVEMLGSGTTTYNPTINTPTGYSGHGYNYGGLLALGGNTDSSITSEASIGDGNWYIGAASGYSESTFNIATPGNGNNFRFGGGGGSLFVGEPLGGGSNNLLVGFSTPTGGTGSATGGGTVQLGNVNTYGGSTQVLNGTLQMLNTYASNNGLPSGTTVTLGYGGGSNAGVSGSTALSNGTLDLAGTNQTIAGIAVASGATASSQTVTDSSATVSTLNLNLAAPDTYGGVITGNVAVAVSGNALTLNNGNSYAGGTSVASGAQVNAVGSAALGTGAVTLNGGILNLSSGGASFGTTVSGFSGMSLNGGATLTGSTLNLTTTSNNEARSAFTTAEIPTGNATGFIASFVYQTSGGADGMCFELQTKGATSLPGTGGSFDTGISPSGGLAFQLYGSNTDETAFETNATVGGYTASTSGGANFTDGNPILVNLVYNSGAQTLTEYLTDQTTNKTSSNVFTGINYSSILGGTSAYVGFAGATGGVNATQNISSFSFTPIVNTTSNTWANNLSVTSTSTVQVGSGLTAAQMGTVTMGSNTTLDVAASGVASNTAYGLTLGAASLSGTNTFNISNNGSGLGTLTLGATSGTANLVQAGGGMLVLGGAGGYSGSTTVGNGTVQLGTAGALPSGTAVVLGDASGDSGILDLDGQGASIGGLSVAAGAGTSNTIGNSSTASNATLTYASSTSSYSGTIVDALGSGTMKTALTVSGGALTLTNTSTYSGATSVTGGQLTLGSGGNLGNTAVSVSSGGTLAVQPGASVTNTISGSVALNHGSAFTMQGDSAISTLDIGGNLTIGDGSSGAPTMTFDLASAAVDNVSVTGSVTVDSTYGGTVVVDPLATDSSLTPGNYNLIAGGSATGLTKLVLSGAVGKTEAVTVGGTNYYLSLGQSGSDEQLDISTHTAYAVATAGSLSSPPAGYTTAFSGTQNPGGANPSSQIVVGDDAHGNISPGYLNNITTTAGVGQVGPKAFVEIDGVNTPTVEYVALALTVNDGTTHEITTAEVNDIISDLNGNMSTGGGVSGMTAENWGTFAAANSDIAGLLSSQESANGGQPFDMVFALADSFPNPEVFGIDLSNESVDGITSIDITDIAVVPEPAMTGIAVLTLGGLLSRRRRSSTKSA